MSFPHKYQDKQVDNLHRLGGPSDRTKRAWCKASQDMLSVGL